VRLPLVVEPIGVVLDDEVHHRGDAVQRGFEVVRDDVRDVSISTGFRVRGRARSGRTAWTSA
jgi:hypothetical protein